MQTRVAATANIGRFIVSPNIRTILSHPPQVRTGPSPKRKVLPFPLTTMPILRLFAIVLTASLAPSAAFAAGPAGALERAAERGDQTVVRSLLQQGADVNAPGVDGSTPLHRAVFADHLDVASLLVKA